MQKLIMGAAFALSTLTFQRADAQVKVNVNVNIGSQPSWGPAGYNYVEYYYLPDIETYYYVPTRQFIYLSNGRWTFAYGLPPVYRNYNLYSGYKVVINEPRAYRYFNTHRVRYAGYRNQPRVVIRNNYGPKYYTGKAYKQKKHKHRRGGHRHDR